MRNKILSECCNVPTVISKSTTKGIRLICSKCGKNIEKIPVLKVPVEVIIEEPLRMRFDAAVLGDKTYAIVDKRFYSIEEIDGAWLITNG